MWMGETHQWYVKEKQHLTTIIDDLDNIAETCTLSHQEIDMKNQSNEQIAHLLREEEISTKDPKPNSF